MEQEKIVNTKDESPIATLVNMVKEPRKDGEKEQKEIATNSHAEKFRTLSFIIIAIGIFAGIVCGASIPVAKIDPASFDLDSSFNIGLMFAIWAITAGAAITSLVVYCILDCMDNILIELKRANHYHKQNTEK